MGYQMKKILVALLVVLIIIGIAGLLLLSDDGNDDEVRPLVAGDFLKYKMTTSGGNATLWMNVTHVNQTGYEFTVIVIHDDGYTEHPSNWFIPKTAKVLFGVSSDDQQDLDELFIGTENLPTPFGTRTVDHYRNVSESQELNIYIGHENGILYRYILDYGDSQMFVELVETTIAWA